MFNTYFSLESNEANLSYKDPKGNNCSGFLFFSCVTSHSTAQRRKQYTECQRRRCCWPGVSVDFNLDATKVFGMNISYAVTVEPRYNDLRYNDIPGITMNIPRPGKSCSKMYGREPRYNDLRYNDIPDITMRI